MYSVRLSCDESSRIRTLKISAWPHRAEYSRKILHSVPLDCCVADTQGAIGYNLQMGLYNEFKKPGMAKPVSTVVTQVIVDKEDPSFQKPTKPIGSFMSKEEAVHARLKS